MRASTIVSILAVLLATGCAHTRPLDVVIDHDGGVDDLIAMSLLMKSRTARLHAVTICPADSYLEPATRATQLWLDRLGGDHITIAQGHSEGTNPFPADWRKDAERALKTRAMTNAITTNRNPVIAEDAAHHLVSVLSKGKFVILETGPLTNIADALKLDPSIKDHITRIYVMGGAVRVPGNVVEKGHDGSAEWNIYNEPKAAADVIASGVPVTLIALDATNHVPLTEKFVQRLEAQPSAASQLAAQAWQLVLPRDGAFQYYFWDTLTAAALLDQSVVNVEPMRVRVITDGASQGRTIEDPNGAMIEVAVGADQQRVESMFLDILGRK